MSNLLTGSIYSYSFDLEYLAPGLQALIVGLFHLQGARGSVSLDGCVKPRRMCMGC